MSAFWNRRRMARAVAGELSGSEELALQQHLAHCRGCREHYERLKKQFTTIVDQLLAE